MTIRYMKAIMSICFLAVLVYGCDTSRARLERTWTGKEREAVIAYMGAPDTVHNDGAGEVLTYTEKGTIDVPSFMIAYIAPGYTYHRSEGVRGQCQAGEPLRSLSPLQSIPRVRQTRFWLNKQGRVYKVKRN